MANAPAGGATRASAHALVALAVLLVLPIALPMAGCGSGGGDAAAASEGREGGGAAEAPPVLIRTALVTTADLARGIRATATLESERHATLSLETSGQVDEILAEVGQEVSAGAPLLRLDRERLTLAFDETALAALEASHRATEAGLLLREAEAASRTATLSRDEAESNLKRTEELSRKSLVSEGDLEAAKYARARAMVGVEAAAIGLEKARLTETIAKALASRTALARDRAQLDLDHTELKAPFDGVVASRSVRVGVGVSAGQAAFELADPLALLAPVYLPQKNLGLLGSAMRVEVRADALPGVVATATVKRLPRTVDAASGNVRLDLAVGDTRWERVPAAAPGGTSTEPPPPPRFLPGMFVTLRLITEERKGVPVVPKKALRLEGDGALCFRIDGDIAREVRFQPGLEDQDHAEVLGGALAPGDRIALVGIEQLEDGARVREAGAEGSGSGSSAAPAPASADGATAAGAPARASGAQ